MAGLRARFAHGRTRLWVSAAITALCSLGLLVLVARSVAGTGQALREAERAADERAREELVAMGWQPPASETLRVVADRLEREHRVEILAATYPFRVELGAGTVTGAAPEPVTLAATSVVVADELGLFPAGVLARAGLRRVALCRDLRENGKPIPSLPNYRNTLLLDAGASVEFLRRLIHHEVFHFVDLADDGEVLWDPTWDRLNPAGFEYGHGGRDMRDRGAAALTDERAGFLTRYATSALEEDKAETFAFMMADPAAVTDRTAHDAVLAAKVARIRLIVAKLDPSMGAEFWARIERHRANGPPREP